MLRDLLMFILWVKQKRHCKRHWPIDHGYKHREKHIKLSSDSLIDTVFAIFGMTDFRIFEPRDVFACTPPPSFFSCPSITPPIWNISLSTNVRKWGGVDSLRGTPIRLRKTGAAWLNAVRQTFASTQTVIWSVIHIVLFSCSQLRPCLIWLTSPFYHRILFNLLRDHF